MYKVAIIDDEPKSIDNLVYLINEYLDGTFKIETYTDPSVALQSLPSFSPDLVFLDVHMPKMSGFELLKKLGEVNFSVIVTTAHSEHAIEAIRLSAFDYLVKPVDDELLIEAFERFKVQKIEPSVNKLSELIDLISNPSINRMAIQDNEGLHLLDIKKIIRVEADGNYSVFYCDNEQKHVSSKTLKFYENKLPASQFIRVHNSHLVNKDHIISFIKSEFLIMKDGKQVPTSRGIRKELKELLKGNF